MGALTLSAADKSVLTSLETKLEDAFKDGIESPAATAYIEAMDRYDSATMTKDNEAGKKLIKNTFLAVVAAMLSTPGLKEAFQATPSTPPVSGEVTVTYARTDGGSGTLTFTDGVLTGHTETPGPT